MNREKRVDLLGRMAQLAHEEGENVEAPPQSFLPLPSHHLALRPEIVVVRGGRGAGKSALFRLLTELGPDVGSFFKRAQVPKADWLDAFSDVGMSHPPTMTLDAMAVTASDAELRAFWLAHLLSCVHSVIPSVRLPEGFKENVLTSPSAPKLWIGWAVANVPHIASSLDDVERILSGDRRSLFATYDHLDRIGHHDRVVRGRYVATLLSMWLSLSNRYRHLRAKVFLRDDLFDAAERAFPDASKLRPRSVSLEWSVEDLYRAAVRQLAAPVTHGVGAGVDMLPWLRKVPGLEFERKTNYGVMPGPMPEEVQRAFAKQVAGEFMGAGAKKGYTHRWIPNRLQDARKRIVPRSMLNLLGYAARRASEDPLGTGERLMRPEDLSGALEQVSIQRAKEVGQEYPLVGRLHNLAGLQVMLDRDVIVERLATPRPDEFEGLSRDGDMVFAELVDLGVLAVRSDGRIDVPDIYRYGFKIKRKGGVARPK